MTGVLLAFNMLVLMLHISYLLDLIAQHQTSLKHLGHTSFIHPSFNKRNNWIQNNKIEFHNLQIPSKNLFCFFLKLAVKLSLLLTLGEWKFMEIKILEMDRLNVGIWRADMQQYTTMYETPKDTVCSGLSFRGFFLYTV